MRLYSPVWHVHQSLWSSHDVPRAVYTCDEPTGSVTPKLLYFIWWKDTWLGSKYPTNIRFNFTIIFTGHVAPSACYPYRVLTNVCLPFWQCSEPPSQSIRNALIRAFSKRTFQWGLCVMTHVQVSRQPGCFSSGFTQPGHFSDSFTPALRLCQCFHDQDTL